MCATAHVHGVCGDRDRSRWQARAPALRGCAHLRVVQVDQVGRVGRLRADPGNRYSPRRASITVQAATWAIEKQPFGTRYWSAIGICVYAESVHIEYDIARWSCGA